MNRFFMRRRRVLAAVLVLIILIGGVGAYTAFSGASAKPGTEAPPALDFLAAQITRPETRRLSFALVLPGTVQALSQASVRSRLSAVLGRVLVREGDTVTEGQVLAEFDTAALRAQRAEREAALASAQANLEQAQRTREANAQLVQKNFITQNAFDSADASFQAQSANVAAARAQLAQTQLQLDDAIVRAPISGIVARRYVQSGEKVGIDAQLLTLVNLGQLEVQAQAAVADVARLRPGTAAQVRIEGLDGEVFAGRVERINPSADPGSRAIDLYVSFANPRNLVRTGMFANVALQLVADRENLSLPLTAVQMDAGQSVVWSIHEGKLVRHLVSVGRRDEASARIEILGGLPPEDPVLATRFDNLKEGAAARVLASPSGAQAPPAAVPRPVDGAPRA